jgi:hypothetical protein
MYKTTLSIKKERLIYLIPELALLVSKTIFFYYYKIIKFKNNKNNKNNKKALVIGNGPSLASFKYDRGEEYDVFCVNNYPKSSDFFTIKPNFLTFIDSMFWVSYDILNKDVSNNVKDTYVSINRVSWKITIIIPKISETIIKSRIINKNVDFIFLYETGYEFESTWLAQLSLKIGLSPPRFNVVVTSLHVSILLGYREVDIVGLDMNRFADLSVDKENNTVTFCPRYFNNKSKKIKLQQNKIIGRASNNMFIRLAREAKTFRWFGIVSNYAIKKGVIVNNKSTFSMLDMFEREKW